VPHTKNAVKVMCLLLHDCNSWSTVYGFLGLLLRNVAVC